MKKISIICVLVLNVCVIGCASCLTDDVSACSEWKPSAELLSRCEPIVKQFWWERSPERKEIVWSSDIRVEGDDTNITVYIPDISVQDEFTIRGMSFTNYYRHVIGHTEPNKKYLEYYFSPSPITNTNIRTYKIIIGQYTGKIPVAFDFYIDLEDMKGYDEVQWLTKIVDGYRTTTSITTNQPAPRKD